MAVNTSRKEKAAGLVIDWEQLGIDPSNAEMTELWSGKKPSAGELKTLLIQPHCFALIGIPDRRPDVRIDNLMLPGGRHLSAQKEKFVEIQGGTRKFIPVCQPSCRCAESPADGKNRTLHQPDRKLDRLQQLRRNPFPRGGQQ